MDASAITIVRPHRTSRCALCSAGLRTLPPIVSSPSGRGRCHVPRPVLASCAHSMQRRLWPSSHSNMFDYLPACRSLSRACVSARIRLRRARRGVLSLAAPRAKNGYPSPQASASSQPVFLPKAYAEIHSNAQLKQDPPEPARLCPKCHNCELASQSASRANGQTLFTVQSRGCGLSSATSL